MKFKFLIVVVLLISVFALCSFAPCVAFYDNYDLQNEKYPLRKTENNAKNIEDEDYNIETELKKIYDEFAALLPENIPTDTEEILGGIGIDEVLSYIYDIFSSEEIAKDFLVLLAIAMLFCIAEIVSADIGEASSAVRSAIAVCVSIPVFSLMKDTLELCRDGLSSGSDFFGGAIPIIASVMAFLGAGSAAKIAAATMSASLGFVSEMLLANLFPIGILIFSLSLISAMDTEGVTSGVAKGARNWFNFFIGISSLLIVAILACQTVISVSADTIAIKGAKYAISGMIPVVGGVVSGALSALISGVKLVSGSIGVLSVMAILSFIGKPLIILLFYRFCMGTCIILTSFTGGSFGERFFTSLRNSLDTVIAVVASSALIYILEIIIIISAVMQN